MVGESNQNVFLIHIDASSFEEFEISVLLMSSDFDITVTIEIVSTIKLCYFCNIITIYY